MSGSAPWDDYLREHFPGYLLPEAKRVELSASEAECFLERLTGRQQELDLLRAVSTLSPHVDGLRHYVLRELPELIRVLPSRTDVLRREWEGGFQGRLDVRGTLAHALAGRPTRFVTRSRQRNFALPENALVRATAERLLQVLVSLRQRGLMSESGWAAGLQECEGGLRHQLTATVLREVPAERIDPRHEQAAHASRLPAHRSTLAWWRTLRRGLEATDPKIVAKVVAEGALQPLDAPTRFEVAVVMRLVQALESRLRSREPSAWTLRRTMVHRQRADIAAFERADGTCVRIFYNQSELPSGPADLGARHYLGNSGRMRPDVTVVTERAGERSAAVLEVKLSDSRSYLLRGYHEAMLYRHEYAPFLKGWPKAVLVSSARVDGPLRVGDEVVAVGWEHWVPTALVDGLLTQALDSSA